MGYIVRMPQLGMSMDEGTVVDWIVDEGDSVDTEELIVVVESEKTSHEVEAREGGVLRRVLVSEGESVEPGDPIGVVADSDEDLSEYEGALDGVSLGDASASDAGKKSSSDSGDAAAADDGQPSGEADASTGGSRPDSSDVRATPGARRLAEESGVDLTTVEGTGPGGVITDGDVEAAAGEEADASVEESTADASDVRVTPGARRLARELDVELSSVEGTGPGGAITDEDVETAASGGADEAAELDTAGPTEARARPSIRRLARELDVDLEAIDGSGHGGPITEGDVRAAAGVASTPSRETPGRTIERSEPLSGVQQTISDRLSGSYRDAVHVTLNRTFETVAIDDVLRAAETLGIDVSINDVLLKAVADALRRHPEFNAVYEDDEHKLIEEVNINVAVNSEEGLFTPVIPSVADKGIREVSWTRRDVTERVLNDEFSVDDLEGGTFTISNLGMFGVDHFDPVINPPQIAILGVGRRHDDGTMTLSLSFDHRVVNGADAAQFLDTIVSVLTSADALAEFFGDSIGGQ